MKKLKLTSLILACLLLASCSSSGAKSEFMPLPENATEISLSDDVITVNGTEISKDVADAVYLSNDIIYYKDGTDFTYGEGTSADMHTEEEALSHSVINITRPGEYVLSGKLSRGQVSINLGEDAEDDEAAVVTLYLNGVDISCSVAPAIIFYNVYECGDDDEDTAKADVDTSKAGANIVIADNTENTINGSYVARIYKSVELDETKTKVVDSEKLHKYDAAINSKMSMNIYGGELGNGILNVNAENEGISTDLHLTVYGGNINITSGNDGINTNEDYVSVATVKAGNVNIVVDGSTGEGDGIDSNGWLVIEGGNVNAYACSDSMDSGLDADKGIDIRGGNVIFTGNMLDHFESDRNSMTFMFSEKQDGNKTYTFKSANGKTEIVITPNNAFSQLVVASDELSDGEYTLTCDGETLRGFESEMRMGGFGGGQRPDFNGGEMPDNFPKDENFKPGEIPKRPNGGERPKDFPDDFPKDGNFKPGEMPTPPDGFEGDRNPPPDGGFRNGQGDMSKSMIDSGDFSEIFNIKKGANTFIVSK